MSRPLRVANDLCKRQTRWKLNYPMTQLVHRLYYLLSCLVKPTVNIGLRSFSHLTFSTSSTIDHYISYPTQTSIKQTLALKKVMLIDYQQQLTSFCYSENASMPGTLIFLGVFTFLLLHLLGKIMILANMKGTTRSYKRKQERNHVNAMKKY